MCQRRVTTPKQGPRATGKISGAGSGLLLRGAHLAGVESARVTDLGCCRLPMNYWPHLMAALIGAGLTIQVGMNATVRMALGSPILATIVNFVVGLGALVVLAIVTGARVVPGSTATVPAWAWLGGLLGAAYVAATTVLGPKIGAAALLALTLAGQMVAALLVDHYGVIGFPQNPVTPTRLVGTLLLVAGVLLILRR